MKYKNVLKSMAFIGVFSIGITHGHAKNQDKILCPTVDELKHLQILSTNINSYDQETQILKFSVTAVEERKNPYFVGWSIEVNNLSAYRWEKLESVYTDIFNRLSPITLEPWHFETSYYSEHKKIPVCIYKVSADKEIQVKARYHDV